MSLTEELEKLRELYDDGVLTEEEFSLAKKQLLHPPAAPLPHPPATPPTPRSAADLTLADAADRYVSYQILSGVIGLAIFILFFFVFILPHIGGNNAPQVQIVHP